MLYDYECSEGHTTEHFRPRMMGVDEDPGGICGTCRRVARRIFTPVAAKVCWEWEMVAVGNEPDVPTRVGF